MKQKFALIAVALTVLGGALLATLATTMHRKITAPPGAERAAYVHQANEELPVLWQAPEFEFSSQTGSIVSTSSLEGNVWIANFIFTTCTTVCPLMTANMVLLQRRLPHSRLRFVSFSVDPEVDTVDVLGQYAEGWAKDESRWLLLRPEKGQLAELARGMRVALEPTDDPENKIMHSSMFFLVDGAGAVRGAYDSNDDRALERLVVDVDELLGQAPPKQAPADGAALYERLSCGACHDNSRLAPPLAGVFKKTRRFEDGREATADRAYLRQSLLAPGKDVVRGYLRLMPSYAAHLDESQISSLLDYLENLTSSATVDEGTPQDTAGRSGKGGASATDVPSDTDATIAVDPVCSMQVRVTDQTPTAQFEGNTYHFCAETCRKQFVANPKKFVPTN